VVVGLLELVLIASHKLHDFVLALSWSIGTCEYDAQRFPVVILLHLFLDEEMQHLVELVHEGGSG